MSANTLRAELEEFQKINPEVNVTAMLIFLFIAQRGITTQKDIEVSLGLTNATASRGVSWWCDVKRHGKEGAGMVERMEDPRDRRYKLVRLTKEGSEFYNKIKKAA
jgi:DNA-binding MarR family transcriptional regulator